LDASGATELVIDNLSVAWLFAAASTQPLYRRRFLATVTNLLAAEVGLVDKVIAIAHDQQSSRWQSGVGVPRSARR